MGSGEDRHEYNFKGVYEAVVMSYQYPTGPTGILSKTPFLDITSLPVGLYFTYSLIGTNNRFDVNAYIRVNAKGSGHRSLYYLYSLTSPASVKQLSEEVQISSQLLGTQGPHPIFLLKYAGKST